MERRALYTALRINWLNDPELEVQDWQVEDYRSFSLDVLFEKLQQLGIQLDKTSFAAYADEADTPEELTDHLVGDWGLSQENEDQIYLLFFELWRRLQTDKPALSILCDEIDHQISLYDEGIGTDPDVLLYLMNRLLAILDDTDTGVEPEEAFEIALAYFAHDLELFLYDFITDQIEEGNAGYANDLFSNFSLYASKSRWFLLLQARFVARSSPPQAHAIFEELLKRPIQSGEDIFPFELLSLIALLGTPLLFKKGLKQVVEGLEQEADFTDLLEICLEHCRSFDLKEQGKTVSEMLGMRSKIPQEQPFHHNQDKDLPRLLQLFSKPLYPTI